MEDALKIEREISREHDKSTIQKNIFMIIKILEKNYINSEI